MKITDLKGAALHSSETIAKSPLVGVLCLTVPGGLMYVVDSPRGIGMQFVPVPGMPTLEELERGATRDIAADDRIMDELLGRMAKLGERLNLHNATAGVLNSQVEQVSRENGALTARAKAAETDLARLQELHADSVAAMGKARDAADSLAKRLNRHQLTEYFQLAMAIHEGLENHLKGATGTTEEKGMTDGKE